jgi:hypothetical protein
MLADDDFADASTASVNDRSSASASTSSNVRLRVTAALALCDQDENALRQMRLQLLRQLDALERDRVHLEGLLAEPVVSQESSLPVQDDDNHDDDDLEPMFDFPLIRPRDGDGGGGSDGTHAQVATQIDDTER